MSDFNRPGTQEEFDATMNNPDVWHPRKGPVVIAREVVLSGMKRQYDVIARRYRKNNTLVICSMMGETLTLETRVQFPDAERRLSAHSTAQVASGLAV